MKKFILKRLGIALIVFMGILLFVFILFEMQPGNPYINFMKPGMSPEQMEQLLESKGYYDPMHIKFIKWLKGMLKFDFGYSIQYGKSVTSLIINRLPMTLALTIPSFLISTFLAIIIGRRVAFYPNSILAKFTDFISGVGISIPAFFVAIILIKIFAFDIPIFPISGTGHLSNLNKNQLIRHIYHAVLPVSTLCFMQYASMVRYVRSFMQSIMKDDYIRTYEGFGIKKYNAYKMTGTRVILPRIITLLFMEIPYLLAGALITETIFVWPGIGKLNYDAVNFRDYPLVLGILAMIAFAVLISNICSDVLNYYLDKRIGI